MSTQKNFHAKKEKKLLKRFWDWPSPPPPLKVSAAADDDDGRVGISKAPLPDGTAELKNHGLTRRRSGLNCSR